MFAEVLDVLCNAPNEEAARRIADRLLEDRLAACINLLAPCRSLYRWEGKLEEASEIPMLIKTTRERYPAVEAAIRAEHPYEVPEILVVPAAGGLEGYLRWVAEETRHA